MEGVSVLSLPSVPNASRNPVIWNPVWNATLTDGVRAGFKTDKKTTTCGVGYIF